MSFNELAHVADMSLSLFERVFKAVACTSPIDYPLKALLKRACNWLRESETTVTEAAIAVQFSDSNYFARQIRRQMGRARGEWREKTLGFEQRFQVRIPAVCQFFSAGGVEVCAVDEVAAWFVIRALAFDQVHLGV